MKPGAAIEALERAGAEDVVRIELDGGAADGVALRKVGPASYRFHEHHEFR